MIIGGNATLSTPVNILILNHTFLKSSKVCIFFPNYTFRKKSSTVLPFDAYLPDRFFPFLLKPSFSSLKIGLAIWSSMTNSVGESSQWEWALMGSLQVVAKGLGSETLGY